MVSATHSAAFCYGNPSRLIQVLTKHLWLSKYSTDQVSPSACTHRSPSHVPSSQSYAFLVSDQPPGHGCLVTFSRRRSLTQRIGIFFLLFASLTPWTSFLLQNFIIGNFFSIQLSTFFSSLLCWTSVETENYKQHIFVI